MTGRRGRGEGSIYQDDRGRWVAALSDGYDSRGRRVRRKRIGRNKSHAVALLAELRQEANGGIAAAGSSVTVGELLKRVVEVVEKRGRQPKTIENYQWACGHLDRGLGRVRLRDLTPLQVERYLESARDEYELGRSSLTRLRFVLRRAIVEAERQGWAARNVAALAEIPESGSKQRRALSREETRRLVDAAAGGPLHAFAVLGFSTGLRPGEILGLRWSDIDLESAPALLQVRHCLKSDSTGTYLGDVKTAGSRRALVLPDAGVAALQQHRRSQAEDRLRLGPEWRELDLVFPNSVGGYADKHNVRRRFGKLTMDAGLGKLPPYVMRHTAITLLSAADMPAELIADMAGHSDTRMLHSVYRHRSGLPVNEAAVHMDRILRAE